VTSLSEDAGAEPPAKLSPDGKTLTVHRNDVDPLSHQESDMVFVKR